MKVSGSHIERVKEWTNIGYEASERSTIQSTVEKLSKEGKHVINIIHGDKTMIGGDYTKSITFLWEADTEEPIYKALMDKAAEEKRLEDELYQQKLLLISENTKIKNILQEIADIEKRIKTAESNDLYTEKDLKKMDTEDILKFFLLGMGCVALCVLFFFLGCNRYIVESGILRFIFIAGAIVGCIPMAIFFFAMVKDGIKDSKTRLDRLNSKNESIINDQKNLNFLKTEIVRKQDELKKCEANRTKLLAELQKKEKYLEEFKKKS